VYMLRNSEVTVAGLQLSSTSEVVVVEQLETMMALSSDVQLYPEERLRLGTQQFQIVTFIVEQILLNLMWIKEIVG